MASSHSTTKLAVLYTINYVHPRKLYMVSIGCLYINKRFPSTITAIDADIAFIEADTCAESLTLLCRLFTTINNVLIYINQDLQKPANSSARNAHISALMTITVYVSLIAAIHIVQDTC